MIDLKILTQKTLKISYFKITSEKITNPVKNFVAKLFLTTTQTK